MKRRIEQQTKGNNPTTALVCCIEDDYKDAIFIDEQVKSTERFIIINKEPLKTIENNDGMQLVDVDNELRNSHLTDDHNTTMVRSDIHDFDKMMHTILMIIEDRLRFVDNIYLNITKGSGEFTSAAIILAMCYERVQVVSVKFSKTAMSDEEIKNRPGLKPIYSEMKEMSQIKGFDLELPNQNLIKALQIYNNIRRGSRTSTNVIRELLEDGVWFELKKEARPDDGESETSLSIKNPRKKTDDEKKIVYREKNFYQRNILGKWDDNNWVEKDAGAAGGYTTSKEGLRILSIFTGDISGLDSYVLINEEKDRMKEIERDKKRVGVMKALLENTEDPDSNNE